MFGCLAVYVAEKIVLILRDKRTETADNGVWLATTEEHHQSLRREFPCAFRNPLAGPWLQDSIFHNPYTGQVVGRNDERRVCGENHLMLWRELLHKIPKEVSLCFPMKSKTRFIKQQNQFPTVLLNLCKLH